MRVLFVHSRMVGGGIERVTLTLIEEFQKRGVECCLALRYARGDLINEARELTDVIELAGSGMRHFVKQLCSLIIEFGPTHFVTAVPDVTLLTLTARRRAGSEGRIIQGVHVSHARAAYPDSVRGWIKGSLERLIARWVCNRVDRVVAVSRGLQEELIGQFGANPQRVQLIHNPGIREADIVDLRDVATSSTDVVRFVAIGRLSREKGFDVLIRALQEVDGNWQLDIYGDGPEYGTLSALASDASLSGRVRLRRYTDSPLAAIDQSDWFILPSRVEGFGVVMIEAMARGVPVIAADCPYGPGEILERGRYGLLVPPDDVGALAAVLREVVAGRHRFDRGLLRQRALEFTVSRSVGQWLEVLHDAGEQAEVK